jgi:aryl-alcohol dehydrogenase-like predicted oxidoreductase
LHGIASRKGCTTGQLALAWVQHQGDDVVPIPGTTKLKNFEENVGSLTVSLSKEDLAEIEALFNVDIVVGDRYADMRNTFEYAETPPLSSWHAS